MGNIMPNIQNILAGLLDILEDYIRLKPGWDGYSGVPVSRELADLAYATAQIVIDAGMPCDRVTANTGNGLSVELNMRCGCVNVFVDVDTEDDSGEYAAAVRLRDPNGNRQYSVISGESWVEVVNKVKELVK